MKRPRLPFSTIPVIARIWNRHLERHHVAPLRYSQEKEVTKPREHFLRERLNAPEMARCRRDTISYETISTCLRRVACVSVLSSSRLYSSLYDCDCSWHRPLKGKAPLIGHGSRQHSFACRITELIVINARDHTSMTNLSILPQDVRHFGPCSCTSKVPRATITAGDDDAPEFISSFLMVHKM